MRPLPLSLDRLIPLALLGLFVALLGAGGAGSALGPLLSPLTHAGIEFIGVLSLVVVATIAFASPAEARDRTTSILGGLVAGVIVLLTLHNLSFLGVPALGVLRHAERAFQLAVAARLLEAGGLLLVATSMGTAANRRGGPWPWLGAGLLYAAAAVVVTRQAQHWTALASSDGGYTGLHAGLESGLIAINGTAALLLLRRGRGRRASSGDSTRLRSGPTRDRYLAAAASASAIAGVSFIGSSAPLDPFGLLGHVSYLAAQVLMVRGLVVEAIREPYRALEAQRREAESAAEQLRGRIRHIELASEAGGAGEWWLDPARGDGHISPSLLRRLGVEEEHSGTQASQDMNWWSQRIHPEDLDWFAAQVQGWVAGELRPFTRDLRLRIDRDHDVVLAVQADVRPAPAKGEVRLYGTWVDVTELRWAEREAARRQEQLAIAARRAEALLELPEVAERLDERGLLKYGLDRIEELTGSKIAFLHFVDEAAGEIELEEWSTRTLEVYCEAVVDRHYPVADAGIWADALRRREPVVVNDYGAVADSRGLPQGHAALHRFLVVPVFEHGAVVALAGVGNRDDPYEASHVETVRLMANELWRLDQRGRALEQLRTSEERFQSMFDHAPLGIALTDLDGRILRANPALADLLGRSVDDLVGARADSHTCSDDLPAEQEAMGRLVGPPPLQKAVTLERRIDRADGQPLWTRMSAATARGADGKPEYLVQLTESVEDRRRLERMFDGFFHQPTSLNLVAAPDGAILLTNEAWTEVLGHRRSDLEAASFLDYVHPGDLEATQAVMAALTSGVPVRDFENRYRHADGSWRTLRWTATAADHLLFGVAIDVTDRAALEARRRQLALAVEQSPESVVITDLDGTIEYVNQSFLANTGYAESEVLGRNPRMLKSGRTAPGAYEAMWAALTRGRPWAGQLINRRKDGSVFIEMASIAPLRGADGHTTHYVAVKEDITEREQLQAELSVYRDDLERLVEERTDALRQAEGRADLILESSAAGLYGLDGEGRVTFVNPRACELLGYEREDLIGAAIHDLVHGHDPDGAPLSEEDCPVHRRGDGDLNWSGEAVFWHAQGHPVFVTVAARRVHAQRRHSGTAVSFLDIGPQKAAQAAQAAALEEARRLARTRSEFLANMSHEIRTPLNAILGFARIGARDGEDPRVVRHFGRILESGDLLRQLVDDVLDYARIEAGKITIERRTIDLGALTSRVVGLVRERAAAKGLELSTELGDQLPATFEGDDLRLSQVLANVLSNAVKFTQEGSVRLHVRVTDGSLRFDIADTGIGMTAEQLGRLFQPFEQGDASTTRRFGGSGLGLAISRDLTTLMGGELSVRSELGVGSTFSISLPLESITSRILRAVPLALTQTSPPARARLIGRSLLVAEDNEINQVVLLEALRPEGCQVTVVGNGKEAVAEVAGRPPGSFDCVLMDVQMPIMDGYEATRRIGQLDPDLPVIGLTAHAFAKDRSRCLRAGMVAHVAKPFVLPALLEAIAEAIDAPLPTLDELPTAAEPSEGPGAAGQRDQGSGPYERPEPDEPPRGFRRRLVEMSVRSLGRAALELRSAAVQQDAPVLRTVAHHIRGITADIIPPDIRLQARELESAASEGESGDRQVAEMADQLAADVERLVVDLQNQLAGRRDSRPSPAPHSAEIGEVLRGLADLLETSDTQANVRLREGLPQLRAALGPLAEDLELAVEDFDYDEASRLVHAAMAQLGVAPESGA